MFLFLILIARDSLLQAISVHFSHFTLLCCPISEKCEKYPCYFVLGTLKCFGQVEIDAFEGFITDFLVTEL